MAAGRQIQLDWRALACETPPALTIKRSPLLLPQVTMPDGRRITTAKGAPQIIGDLLSDAAARAAVDN